MTIDQLTGHLLHSLVRTIAAAALGLSIFVSADCVVLAQEASGSAPVLDSPVIESRLDEFSESIEAEIEAGKIVGCAALLFRNNEVEFSKTWGNRDREKNETVEADTIWRIYSMTKPITSVAVMQLVESGELKLDEPVSTYLPEFKELKVQDGEVLVPCAREMTVRDLLRHTSGLTYGFFGNSEIDKMYSKAGILIRDKDVSETVSKLAEIPLMHQPGSRWHYSVSTDVLGRLVEVASGKSFKDYLHENIFQPLEMKDTFFTVPEDKRHRFAQLYAPDGQGGLKPANRWSSYRFLNETDFHSGGGGLCSTTDDYLCFCKMLMNEGELNGTRLLKSETVREMIKDQLPEKAARGSFKFGLGFHISPEGHYSWGGAAGTRFWVDPDKKIVGVFMVQINPYRAKEYGYQFKRVVYDALGD